MFASYVSEAFLGYIYVLGACERRGRATGTAGASGAAAPHLLHILSIITHSVQKLQVFCSDDVCTQKTGAHLCEHRSDLHVM